MVLLLMIHQTYLYTKKSRLSLALNQTNEGAYWSEEIKIEEAGVNLKGSLEASVSMILNHLE